MAVRRLIAAMAAVWSAAGVACESVPTLTFAPADATQGSVADAPGVIRDAPDAIGDVSDVLDAGADAFASDALADAADAPSDEAGDSSVADGCPGPNPPMAAYACCGALVCEGQCTGRCDACAAKCTSPGTFCCARNNSIQCLSVGMYCK